jgi:hypothetical protein
LTFAAALCALVVAQPALAYTETGHTGTTGVHSVTDTKAHPGVVCVYDYSTGDGAYRLNHIYVNAPNMKAVAGMSSEKVAWTFTIQRRDNGFGGAGPWQNRYTSPKFSAMTNSTTNAAFSQMGVKVIVPYEYGADAAAEYRALVKMYWYGSNGTSVIGSATGRLGWYNLYEELDTFTRKGLCEDYETA